MPEEAPQLPSELCKRVIHGKVEQTYRSAHNEFEKQEFIPDGKEEWEGDPPQWLEKVDSDTPRHLMIPTDMVQPGEGSGKSEMDFFGGLENLASIKFDMPEYYPFTDKVEFQGVFGTTILDDIDYYKGLNKEQLITSINNKLLSTFNYFFVTCVIHYRWNVHGNDGFVRQRCRLVKMMQFFRKKFDYKLTGLRELEKSELRAILFMIEDEFENLC